MTQKNTTRVETEEMSGGLILPDAADFSPQVQTVPKAETDIGRPRGLDLAKWAFALIDLGGKPDRITLERIRLAGKGYKKAEGVAVVPGWAQPEVWVKPRHIYEADRQTRKATIDQNIASGEMMQFADLSQRSNWG